MGGFNDPEVARRAGSKGKRGENQLTKEAKEMIAMLTDKLFDDIIDNLDQLELREKAQLFPKLMEYRLAKMRSVESKIDISNLTFEEAEKLIMEKILSDE